MFANGDVLVQKFGGSSMGSLDRIRKVAERVADQARRGKRLAVVVSAMGDTTDELIGLMNAVHSNPDRRELDQLTATGEIVSAALAASALQNLGIPARSFHAFNLRIETQDNGSEAEIRSFARLGELGAFLAPGHVAVVAGFQGINEHGDLTTLGRGGSDITAVALARDLGQKVCEKFTDEDGVFSADPRIIATARKIWHLNYDEMETLARYGNGILHPRSLSYARAAGIRIHVRSSFSRAEGSIIGPDGDDQLPVKSLACDRQQAIMVLHGLRRPPDSQLYARWNDLGEWTSREWRPQNEFKGSFRFSFRLKDSFTSVPTGWEIGAACEAEEVEFHARLWFVSLVGEGLLTRDDLVSEFISAVRIHGFEPVLINHEGCRLSLAFPEDRGPLAMQFLHRRLEELFNS